MPSASKDYEWVAPVGTAINQANDTFGDDVYAFGPAGPGWDSLNLEQQGGIVDEWFGGIGPLPADGHPQLVPLVQLAQHTEEDGAATRGSVRSARGPTSCRRRIDCPR